MSTDPRFTLLDRLVGQVPTVALLVAAARNHGEKAVYPTRLSSPEDRVALIQAHLDGRGVPPRICLSADGKSWKEGRGYGIAAPCAWEVNGDFVSDRIVIDCDGGDHKDGSDAAADSARDLAVGILQGAGCVTTVVRSHGGHGWHVWVLLAQPEPLMFLRWAAKLVQMKIEKQLGFDSVDAFPGSDRSAWPPVALPFAGDAPGVELGGGQPVGEPSLALADWMTPNGALGALKTAWKCWKVITAEERKSASESMRMKSAAMRVRRGKSVSPAQRAEAFLSKIPPAIEGHGGNAATYLASLTGHDFGLTPEEFAPLFHAWNARCSPPWSDREIDRFVERSYRSAQKPFGWRMERVP
jgi:hypothetical protein